jgi:hypothetical protein
MGSVESCEEFSLTEMEVNSTVLTNEMATATWSAWSDGGG